MIVRIITLKCKLDKIVTAKHKNINVFGSHNQKDILVSVVLSTEMHLQIIFLHIL